MIKPSHWQPKEVYSEWAHVETGLAVLLESYTLGLGVTRWIYGENWKIKAPK